MSKVLTLETTTPDILFNLNTTIRKTQMILRSYRVDLLATSLIPYRDLGIGLSFCGSNYIIDNVQGQYFFRLLLSGATTFTIDGSSVNSTFVANSNIPLMMSGDINNQLSMTVYYLDRVNNVFVKVPAADLKYLCMVFEILE